MSSKAIEELRAAAIQHWISRGAIEYGQQQSMRVVPLATAEEIIRRHFPAPQQDAGDWEKVAREMLPCSQQIKRVLTIAGVPKEAVLDCGTEVHHIYCPAYYVPAVATALRSAAATTAPPPSSEQERRQLEKKLVVLRSIQADNERYMEQRRIQIVEQEQRIAELEAELADAQCGFQNANEILGQRIIDLEEEVAALEASKPAAIEQAELLAQIEGLTAERDHYREALAKQPAPITDLAEAVRVLNEKKWRGRDDWQPSQPNGNWIWTQTPSRRHKLISEDALAIANYLARTAPPAAPVEGTWQPIASAPKDGTPILAWMIDDAPHRAWQSKDERNAPGICYWTQHNGGGWVSHRFGTPTHWMPLPSPPKENAE